MKKYYNESSYRVIEQGVVFFSKETKELPYPPRSIYLVEVTEQVEKKKEDLRKKEEKRKQQEG